MGVAGGNMEGKEVRFGIPQSVTWATFTTGASNGSVNSMHDSYMPLGGLVPLVLIQIGEVVPGGVGSGLYGIVVFAIIAMFVAGLMVGRTPEYLGKKLEAKEVKMAMLAILIMPVFILGFTAVSAVLPVALAGLANPGPRGYTEILYAFSSAAGNNGSAFAGLTANAPWYDTTHRHRHARLPLRHHRPGHGDRRIAGGQAEAGAVGRHVPDQRPSVRRPAHRRHRDRERT